jgi:hypothetical protein
MSIAELPPEIQPEFPRSLDFKPQFCCRVFGSPISSSCHRVTANFHDTVFSGFQKFQSKFLRSTPAIGGVIEKFVRKACHGGRLLGKPGVFGSGKDEGKFVLYDCNSLYAAAMCEIFAKWPLEGWGVPEVVHEGEKLEAEGCEGSCEGSCGSSYAVVEVEIESITPTSFYPNVKPGRAFYDSVELKELEKYCSATYRVLRGYRWTFPASGKAADASEEAEVEYLKALYDRKKNAETPEERNSAKLELCGLFGMLLKRLEVDKKKHFSSRTEAVAYAEAHSGRFHRLTTRSTKSGDDYCVSLVRLYNKGFGYTHIGCCILSTARRIMNPYLAALGDNVLLSSTDSILIPSALSSILPIGTGMGEFKEEAASSEAIILNANCYWLGDGHIRKAGIQHPVDRDWFLAQLHPQPLKLHPIDNSDTCRSRCGSLGDLGRFLPEFEDESESDTDKSTP